jgi:hypothetical protein
MKTKNLKQYIIELQEAGYTGTIEAAKEEFRKKYAKLYRQDYAKSKKRLELTLTSDEHEKLKAAAKESHMKIGTLSVRFVMAALHRVSPQVREDIVRDAVAVVRKTHNTLNQWVRISNKNNNLYLENILACEKLLQSTEKMVEEILTRPRDILHEVEKALELNPDLINPLLLILLQHLSKQVTTSANGDYR